MRRKVKDDDDEVLSCPICCDNFSRSIQSGDPGKWTRAGAVCSESAKTCFRLLGLLPSLAPSSGPSDRLPCQRPCCSQYMCRGCFYRHVMTSVNDSTHIMVPIKCPLGCGHEVSDEEICTTIRQAHPVTVLHGLIGPFWYRVLDWWGCFGSADPRGDYAAEDEEDAEEEQQLAQAHDQRTGWSVRAGERARARLEEMRRRRRIREYDRRQYNYRRFGAWLALHHSSAVRRDLLRYFSWSLQRGLLEIAKEGQGTDSGERLFTMHCPRPDCACVWFHSAPYRREKQAHERHYESPRSSYSLYSLATTVVSPQYFYHGPPLEELEIAQVGDKKRPSVPSPLAAKKKTRKRPEIPKKQWLEAEDVDIWDLVPDHLTSPEIQLRRARLRPLRMEQQRQREQPSSKKDQADGRRTTCPLCKYSFCGLCRQPWHSSSRNNKKGHSNVLCSHYQRRLRRAHDDEAEYMAAANAVDARSCPTCTVRTERIDGCNHMTCACCGTHWCYVCEEPWSPRHYECRDVDVYGRPQERQGPAACVIL